MNCKEIFDKAFSGITPLSDTQTVLMNVKERAGKMKTNDGFERRELHEITVQVPERKPSRRAPAIAGISLFTAAAAGFAVFAWNNGTYRGSDSGIRAAASHTAEASAEDMCAYTTAVYTLPPETQITQDTFTVHVNKSIELEDCTVIVHDYRFDGMTLRMTYSLDYGDTDPTADWTAEIPDIFVEMENGEGDLTGMKRTFVGRSSDRYCYDYVASGVLHIPMDKLNVMFYDEHIYEFVKEHFNVDEFTDFSERITELANEGINTIEVQYPAADTVEIVKSGLMHEIPLEDGTTVKLNELYIASSTVSLGFDYDSVTGEPEYPPKEADEALRNADIRILLTDGTEVTPANDIKYSGLRRSPFYVTRNIGFIDPSEVQAVYVNGVIIYGSEPVDTASYGTNIGEGVITLPNCTVRIIQPEFDGRIVRLQYEIIDISCSEGQLVGSLLFAENDGIIQNKDIASLGTGGKKYMISATADIPDNTDHELKLSYSYYDEEPKKIEFNSGIVLSGDSSSVKTVIPQEPDKYAKLDGYRSLTVDYVTVSPFGAEFELTDKGFDLIGQYLSGGEMPEMPVHVFCYDGRSIDLTEYEHLVIQDTDFEKVHYQIYLPEGKALDVDNIAYIYIGDSLSIPVYPMPEITTAVSSEWDIPVEALNTAITTAVVRTDEIVTSETTDEDTTLPPENE